MNCPNYNCLDDVGTQTLNDCGEELLGGSSGMLLLHCDHQLTDPSSESAVQAEIDAGRATLFLGMKIGINAASPIKVDSNTACQNQRTVTYDRSLTLVDPNVNDDNVALYDKLFDGRTFGGVIIFECGTEESENGEQVTWIDSAISFDGSRILPPTNNEFQRFEGTGNWRSKNNGRIYPAPPNIFN